MYECPIKPVVTEMYTQITRKFEEGIYRVVQEYGFDINKEELVKALQYDRDQYDKGYKDAVKEIFDDIEKLKFTEYDWHDRVEWDGIAELKKKYMI